MSAQSLRRAARACAPYCLLSSILLSALLATMPAHAAGNPVTAAAPAAALPGNSLYQLSMPLVAQDGHTFKLRSRRGQPALVSMFYNSCEFVCPMRIDTMHLLEQELTPAERNRIAMLLVTFDPARDDVKTLQGVASARALDPAHWTLARTDADNVRKLAAALAIQYRQLPDGGFNHSTVLVLLDSEGRVAGRSNKLGMLDPAFLQLIRQTLAAAPAS